jgi:capsular polysaccharide biosynthesis protein
MKEFKNIIKERWQTMLIITIIITAIVFSVSALITPKYKSQISLIVIQKQASYKVDAFSAAKSAEYLSDILSRAVYTDTFLNDVLHAPVGVDKKFSDIPEKRKEEWKNAISVKKLNNTGIIEISVYDESRQEAEKITRAIDWSLSVRGDKYHGGGDRIKVELIDGPITSVKPVKPNILLNTLLGFIFGVAISFVVVYFFRDFDLRIFRRVDEKEKSDWLEKKVKKEFSQENRKASILQTVTPVEGPDFLESELEKNKQDLTDEKAEETKIEKELVKDKNKTEEKKNIPSSGFEKKSAAPDNLPVFEKDQKGFVDMEKLSGSGGIDKGKDEDYNKAPVKEPTEDEVKKRLNKLLKGDL